MSFNNNFRTILGEFFTFTLYIKMLHWQTKSYALHKTTDALLVALDPLFDQFLESLQGELDQRIELSSDLNFVVSNMNKATARDINIFLTRFEKFLSTDLKSMIRTVKVRNTTSLENIIDEILGEIQKTKYLITFN